MINVSEEFKKAMRRPVKELDAYIVLEDGTRITSDSELIKFKINGEGGMCRTVMRRCEIQLIEGRI